MIILTLGLQQPAGASDQPCSRATCLTTATPLDSASQVVSELIDIQTTVENLNALSETIALPIRRL